MVDRKASDGSGTSSRPFSELHAFKLRFFAGLTNEQAAKALGVALADEDSPHGFGSSSEEMGSIIPFAFFVVGEPKPGFVNQRGGLKGLARGFGGHFGRGEPAQFAVHPR